MRDRYIPLRLALLTASAFTIGTACNGADQQKAGNLFSVTVVSRHVEVQPPIEVSHDIDVFLKNGEVKPIEEIEAEVDGVIDLMSQNTDGRIVFAMEEIGRRKQDAFGPYDPKNAGSVGRHLFGLGMIGKHLGRTFCFSGHNNPDVLKAFGDIAIRFDDDFRKLEETGNIKHLSGDRALQENAYFALSCSVSIAQ